MQLSLHDTLHGFSVVSAAELPEIEGTAYVLYHKASGARALYLANDDENKAFAIGFKTPPRDDTGVFHILEHSVLCGSDRFPAKEPFVNLLKSSMQTFLNAMTFPDKTLYPVASTNETDLLNLMDVYMDAVLHPAIYSKREIFEQEGWHYELDAPGEPLRYNGVVFNEMKGALSDPDAVLYNTLAAALFPDSAYAFESGGDPRAIPTLSYEDFLDTHRRHYRCDNSYIVLYGNMQVERELAFLDERYLGVAGAAGAAGDGAASAAGAGASAPNPLTLQEPVCRMNITRSMQTAPENACAGLAYIIGTASDRQRVLDVDILLDALMGSNVAPLKRALLEAGIAGDAYAQMIDALMQPMVLLQIKGCQKGAAAQLNTLVSETISRLCTEGIDRTLLNASLARAEFYMREGDFGTADGVVYAMECLSGWLYSDDDPVAYLRYEEAFARMHEKLETDYFEQLAREIFLDNTHRASAEIVPVKTPEASDEAKDLAAVYAGLDAEGIARTIEETAALHRAQETPDSPEALATLPLLQLSDIAAATAEPACTLLRDTPLDCLYHATPTKRIDYLYYYFPLEGLAFDELPYATLLTRLLGKLATRAHTAEELDTLVQSRLGTLRFFTEVHESESDANAYGIRFVVGASALAENVVDLATIPAEIWTSTLFDDRAKIKDILLQLRIGMEQEFALSGHSAAAARAGSYCCGAGVVRDAMTGVNFYRFLKDLIARFDDEAQSLIARLQNVAARLFVADGTLASFTGSSDNCAHFWEVAPALTAAVGAPDAPENRLVIPAPTVANEAFIVPTDVCFAATAGDLRALDAPYTGAWQVASRALSYDYLWNEVRVKGGAYGAGLRVARSGGLQFYSYRDPHLDATLARFAGAGAWLANFAPAEDEMRGYVISSVAGIDAPKKAREIARRQDIAHLCHFAPNYRAAGRKEVLDTNAGTLGALAPVLDAASAQNAVCVFGSREIIEASTADLTPIDLLA
ncbi:MAG: insulinase family protein [Raoultibacter sp.]